MFHSDSLYFYHKTNDKMTLKYFTALSEKASALLKPALVLKVTCIKPSILQTQFVLLEF